MEQEMKEKILKMSAENKPRSTMRKVLRISKDRFYKLLRELISEGHNLNLSKRNFAINRNDFMEDKFLDDMLNYKLTDLQYLFLEQNKNMKRTELAKELKIPKVALNFILHRGV